MSNNYELQNQDLRSTVSEQIVELDDNELDGIAGGDGFFGNLGEAFGSLVGSAVGAGVDFYEGLGNGYNEGLNS